MARSDKYKIIIGILAVIIFIVAIIVGYSFSNTYYEFFSNLKKSNFIDIDNTYLELEDKSNPYGFVVSITLISIGFVFCMFFYLLSDMLDRLEIISAQTTRSTRVLEKAEDEK